MPATNVTERQAGKYTLLTKLTVGGMAELFLGYTRGPGGFRKYVVIKRILPDASANEQFVEMFLDEARITAGFSHSNIAQVYDLGEDDDGLYVVMEFVPGQNLNQIVNACADQQAIFPLGFSLSVLHECALALHYAHTYRKPTGEAYPVIHRDVAQKNIMVTFDGQVRLLDFGIAKARNALARTRVGTVKGTAGYMSPEQVRGEEIDGRSDVFALGVVLWESCTGRRLFSGDSENAEMRMILEAPIPAPATIERSVSPAISAVVMRALERSREDRYKTAKDLAKALYTAASGILYDADERAAFMRERFAGRILATERIFNVSDSAAESPSFQEVARSFQEKPRSPKTQVRVAPGVKKTDADDHLAVAMMRAEAVGVPTRRTGPSLGVPIIVAVLVLTAAAIAVKTLYVPNEPDPVTGLRRFPGEPDVDPATGTNGSRPAGIPGVPLKIEPPPKVEPPPVPNAGVAVPSTAPIALPPPAVPSPPKPVKPLKIAKGTPTGTLVLGLLPDGAAVYKGKQLVGDDTSMKLVLPVGKQHLTVVGRDGIRRGLTVDVRAGSNPYRLNVKELSAE